MLSDCLKWAKINSASLSPQLSLYGDICSSLLVFFFSSHKSLHRLEGHKGDVGSTLSMNDVGVGITDLNLIPISSSFTGFLIQKKYTCARAPNPIMAGKDPSGFVSSKVIPIGHSSSSMKREAQQPKGRKENKMVVRKTQWWSLLLTAANRGNYQ